MSDAIGSRNHGIIALAVLCIATVPALAFAGSSHDSRLTGPFVSETAAVLAASNQYNPASVAEDREFMGGILRKGQHFFFTVSAGETGQDRITAKIPVPAGFELIAFWHTHGAHGHSRRYFSHVDTGLVEQHRKPFYLADYTGELKVFSPGDATISAYRAQRIGLPRVNGFAKGKVLRTADGSKLKVQTG